MSEQTNSRRWQRAGPKWAKKRAKLSACAPGHPEQALAAGLDLVDQGQVLMPAAVGDLVDADGADALEAASLQSPLDDILDRIEDLLPAGVDVRAVLCHDRPPCQRARNTMYASHSVCLPTAHGTCSDLDPQRGHCTRRMAYSSITAKPHSGINSKRRTGNWS